MGYDKNGDGRIDRADIHLLTKEDAVERVMRPHFWNRWHGDDIESQSIANLLVDWVWGSGRHGITNVQRHLGVKADGIVGRQTLKVLNENSSERMFRELKELRRRFLKKIVERDPGQKVFLKGWLRRLDAIGYGWLHCNGAANPIIFEE